MRRFNYTNAGSFIKLDKPSFENLRQMPRYSQTETKRIQSFSQAFFFRK